jgi:hypothetical protein
MYYPRSPLPLQTNDMGIQKYILTAFTFYPIHHSNITLTFSTIQPIHYIYGRVMLWLRRSDFISRPVHVGVLVHKGALEEIFP